MTDDVQWKNDLLTAKNKDRATVTLKLYAKPEPEPEPLHRSQHSARHHRPVWFCSGPLSRLGPVLDTYSADFQKCPGWESLRFSLGSFSSMSASWVKVGRSLRSYDQQAERISCEHRQQAVSETLWPPPPPLCLFISETRELTVTSLPRLISARTFLMPSPLPTCQMVASTGWLVIGQSLAWSSYQIVL